MSAVERYSGPRATIDLAAEAWKLAQTLTKTSFVPDALKNKPEETLAVILAGAEVGVSPMQALLKIHNIKGRPAMAAELMRAIILRDGHELWIEEQSSTRCILAAQRKGSSRESRTTWTMDDARRAGLLGRENWKNYPQAMLLARATGQLARAIFPDVLAGISYTVEEIEDGDIIEVGGEIIDPTPAAPVGERRTTRARRAATRGAAEPTATDAPPAPPVQHESAPLPGEDDDEPVDAVLVDDQGAEIGDDGPLEPDAEEPGGEVPAGRSYRPEQVIAIRCGELKIDRDGKLDIVSYVVGRPVETTKGLENDEVTAVLEFLSDFDGDFTPIPHRAAAPKAAEPDPAEDPPPSARRRRVAAPDEPAPPAPVRPPATLWTGDDWRTFLTERGVKVSELVKAAGKIVADYPDMVAPTTLDEIAGSGIEALLVGFVEDLSIERSK